jgi:hypothetical protein
VTNVHVLVFLYSLEGRVGDLRSCSVSVFGDKVEPD